ncbi:MAG: MIP family channel proteins [Verrucomicrobiales bacterium]|jgi:MIP family channel proteins
MKKYFAEALGTFALVFAGTGAIIVNDISNEAITHLGIALTFGLIVMAMIYTIGDVSGAHINPAVTIAFWVSGRHPTKDLLPYIISQIFGALFASALLRVLFLEHIGLGGTIPSGPWWQSLVLEVVLTFLLMFVVLNVSTGAKEKGIMAGAAVGCIVAVEAMFAGPICGASMNPARSIGPALVSGQVNFLWIYIVAPIAGALLAIPTCRCIQHDGCCEPEIEP